MAAVPILANVCVRPVYAAVGHSPMCVCVRERAWAVDPVCACVRRPSEDQGRVPTGDGTRMDG